MGLLRGLERGYGGRPYAIMDGEDHPFYGEEYVVVGVTPTERGRAVALTPETWSEGAAPKPIWASPWYVLTLKHANITDRVDRLTKEATEHIAAAVAHLIGTNTS